MVGMDMMEMLRRSGGLDAVSKQLGISPAVAATGAEALLPAIRGGIGKRIEAGGGGEGGLGRLIVVLDQLGGGSLAANVLGPEESDVSRGNQVLGQIFGSKDISRSVAADAARHSGVDAGVLKRMLPLLTMLVGGYLSARAGGSGAEGTGGLDGLGEILGSMIRDQDGAIPAVSSGLEALGSLLDFDGDGNPLDDIIGLAGGPQS